MLALRTLVLVVSVIVALMIYSASEISYSKYARSLGPTLAKAYFGFLFFFFVGGPQIALESFRRGENWQSWS
jgi:hypothetical protein